MKRSRATDVTSADSKRHGVYPAIVTANTEQGKDSRYRLKVRFPWLPSESDNAHWARMTVPMAGAARGTYMLPEVGDQVLVVFEHGDISRPIIVGSLWSQKQPPPESNSDGKNNLRVLKSRSGHRLIFDDTEGAENVILVDSTKRNKIVLDSITKTVTIESCDGNIEIKAPKGTVRLHGKNVNVTTKADFSGVAGTCLMVESKGQLNVRAEGQLRLDGNRVALNTAMQPRAPRSTLAAKIGLSSPIPPEQLIDPKQLVEDTLKQVAKDVVEGLINGDGLDIIAKRALATVASNIAKELLEKYVDIEILREGLTEAISKFLDKALVDGVALDDAALDALEAGALAAGEAAVKEIGEKLFGGKNVLG